MKKKFENKSQNSTKKVLMIAQSTYEYDARIIRYCRALKEQGIQTDVICYKFNKQKTFEIIDGINVFRITDFNNKDTITRYIIFSIIFLIKALIKTIQLHKKNNYSVIHVHNMPDYLVFAAIYPKLKGVPVILDIHDLTVELFKEKWSENKFKLFKPLLIFTEGISCNFADHIITVTKECIEKLVSRGINREKISLIMNAPDDHLFSYSDLRFRKNGTDKTFRILYHGTLAKRFGLHNVVLALKKVLEINPDIEFHIYGNKDSEYAKELRDLAEKLNIENKVKINQSVSHEKVNEIIRDYDLGVVTYEPTEYMNLAFPTKAGEYALTGLPMIMTELQAVKSVFKKESIVFLNTPDGDTIAEKIISLIDNKEKRKNLSFNALDDIKQITWTRMKNNYNSIIKKLLSQKFL